MGQDYNEGAWIVDQRIWRFGQVAGLVGGAYLCVTPRGYEWSAPGNALRLATERECSTQAVRPNSAETEAS